jgi:ubiquinone biosynthesis protein
VRAALARGLLDCLLRQVMLEGTFHADPHPGNVLLLADGRLGLLDFGSVGRIDAGLRTALQRLLLALDRATRPAWLTRCWKWSSGPGSWTSRAWNGC